MNHFDAAGKRLKAGDIIKYDEGPGCAKSIDEIVDIAGELHGVVRVDNIPRWRWRTVDIDDHPTSLKYYCSYPYTSGVCKNTTLIGNVKDNPEMLTVEFAKKIFGETNYD